MIKISEKKIQNLIGHYRWNQYYWYGKFIREKIPFSRNCPSIVTGLILSIQPEFNVGERYQTQNYLTYHYIIKSKQERDINRAALFSTIEFLLKSNPK